MLERLHSAVQRPLLRAGTEGGGRMQFEIRVAETTDLSVVRQITERACSLGSGSRIPSTACYRRSHLTHRT
ncbi:hypothetical protein BN2475_710015 [Paraburkholderia ribeironis]|uniref:Uncharacterized protein n=1 Tax=Paraburkholderia ribeironis TaxID=1247936 RepID=A0A1N7SJ67_9BURK|nr:hypothetical protein BN2475_710015 [Paraburkholderia ribeironis]